MSDRETFDKILQVHEYKAQISRIVVEDIFAKLHRSAQQWIELFQKDARKRRRHDRYSCWHRLELFGSSAVGTSTDTSDLDVNLIVPPMFTAENFFENFPKVLAQSGFMNIYTVINASVPLVCFTYKNMDVDLCFTVISHETCPTITDIMRFTREQYTNRKKGFLATQGLRVAYILKECFLSNTQRLVDEGANPKRGSSLSDAARFYQLSGCSRQILRQSILFVKSWARNRGIYGNVFCFPGGISWTIMIIFCFLVCKRLRSIPFENWTSTPSQEQMSQIMRKFLTYFFIFYDVYFDVTKRHVPLRPRVHLYDVHKIDLKSTASDRDEVHAIMQCAMTSNKYFFTEINQKIQAGNLTYESESVKDQKALMYKMFETVISRMSEVDPDTPDMACAEMSNSKDIVEVLNPAPSYTNSVYNVTMSSVQAMHTEFRRAVATLCNGSPDSKRWEPLLQKIDFFRSGESFIVVELRCSQTNFQKTIKTFESQIKHFLYHIESQAPDRHFRLFPANVESGVAGCEEKKFTSLLSRTTGTAGQEASALSQADFFYFRYIFSIDALRDYDVALNLDDSSHFLRYAFERSEENITFLAERLSGERLRAFYGV